MALSLYLMDNGLSFIQRKLWTSFLWIYLLLSIEISGVVSDLCVYQRSKYNYLDSKYDKTLTTKHCAWGCCYDHNSPCCTAPISLIVGSVLGGLLLLALVMVLVFCCCVCKRRQTTQQRGAVLRFGSSHTTQSAPPQQSNVVYHSETSGRVDIPDPMIFDAPPSYDEVMRGETNHAFKPDTAL